MSLKISFLRGASNFDPGSFLRRHTSFILFRVEELCTESEPFAVFLCTA